MIERIKGWIKVFNYDTLGQNGESYKRSIRIICLATFVATFITSILNFKNHSWMVGITTLLFSLYGLGSAILLKKKDGYLQLVVNILAVFLALFFTYYYLDGSNQGFAALWILLAPMSLVVLGGARQSLVLGLYFMIIVSLLSYTPLKSLVCYEYNIEFVHRFPVLYGFSFVVSMVINYQIQKYRIFQNNAVDDLQTAVLAERKRNQEMSMKMIMAMSEALDAKDSYTNSHSQRVAKYGRLIAKELGLSEEEQQIVYYGGLVHDIGKIGVSELTLNSQKALTDEQFFEIKKHPEVGKNIIEECIDDERILNSIEDHHERYDGSGYPKGLKGNDIPIYARILSVADSFDAMNSTRAYRKACDKNYILTELEKGKNKQFDPEVVDALIRVLNEQDFVNRND